MNERYEFGRSVLGNGFNFVPSFRLVPFFKTFPRATNALVYSETRISPPPIPPTVTVTVHRLHDPLSDNKVPIRPQ